VSVATSARGFYLYGSGFTALCEQAAIARKAEICGYLIFLWSGVHLRIGFIYGSDSLA
jgi:hypothetical protein